MCTHDLIIWTQWLCRHKSLVTTATKLHVFFLLADQKRFKQYYCSTFFRHPLIYILNETYSKVIGNYNRFYSGERYVRFIYFLFFAHKLSTRNKRSSRFGYDLIQNVFSRCSSSYWLVLKNTSRKSEEKKSIFSRYLWERGAKKKQTK